MKRILFLTAIVFLCFQAISAQPLKLASLFSDHMVLQQVSEVSVWGKSLPNATIYVSTSWNEKATATATALGKWDTKIKTPIAGGPYTMQVSDGKQELTINDILIGEVWLCSGQSNMEMPLAGWPPNDTIFHAKEEIASANNKNIRMFTVSRSFSIEPLDTCVGNWTLCDVENVGKFSATAYFFGKKLNADLNVPVGLIHSSWGGTPAEAWADEAHLSAYPEFVDFFKNAQLYIADIQKQKNWIEQHAKVFLPNLSDEKRWQNLDFGDMDCMLPMVNDSAWMQMILPNKIEQTSLGEFDGAIWFRKQVEVPANWENNELELSLSMIDDMDIAFFNGQKVGGMESPGAWQVVRNYTVPAGAVKKGLASIAIRVIDYQGGGGIWGKPEQMYLKLRSNSDTTVIKLAGAWRYIPVAEYINNVFYKYDAGTTEFMHKPKVKQSVSAYKPSTLFNAMINPLIPYAIKGTIWYQGEANVGRAEQYATLFPSMINNWREKWGIGNFPFYYVQIAPWEYSGELNCESAWLRDAQRRALALTNTGMAVTLDIGNVKNIHPGNKKDVGDRLAFLALAKTYKKEIEYSGPVFEGVSFKEGKAYLSFSHTGSGLKLIDTGKNEFEIAGEDGKFVPAAHSLENGNIVVWSTKVLVPSKVRYAFKNGSQASLFNNEGLPASSFTTEAKIE